MKKKLMFRLVAIGCLHSFLYLGLVPFVIYPMYDDNGFMMVVVIAVALSISMLATLFIKKNKKNS